MAKKGKRRGSRTKTLNIGKTAAGIAGVAIIARPYVQGKTVPSLMKGDVGGAMQGIVDDSRVALSPTNVLSAAAPSVALGVAKLGASLLGVSAPSVRLGRKRVKAW